ncbi:MAG: hypothetical protein Ta2B_26480 [Termitinemataceae bacterium]|nr:MAG: hypothetical protein Ta2B_26480 [Termitinemataceae bacterium]
MKFLITIIRLLGKVYRNLPFQIPFVNRIYIVFWKHFGKFTPRQALAFELHITDHCNLNCASCAHFSSLSEPKFADMSTLEKDFSKISQLSATTGGGVDNINLLGGEPLLHPGLQEILVMTRKYFTATNIYLITNGILLLKQNDAFWDICAKNNIKIKISYYPVKLNYKEIKKVAKKHGVQIFARSKMKKTVFFKYELDKTGKQNIKSSFKKCWQANMCSQLYEGKIFPCPVIAYLHILNKYFNENFIVSDEDYIDIYSVNSISDILSFLCKPVPFCRYCTNECPKVNWEISKKNISEWVR